MILSLMLSTKRTPSQCGGTPGTPWRRVLKVHHDIASEHEFPGLFMRGCVAEFAGTKVLVDVALTSFGEAYVVLTYDPMDFIAPVVFAAEAQRDLDAARTLFDAIFPFDDEVLAQVDDDNKSGSRPMSLTATIAQVREMRARLSRTSDALEMREPTT